MLPASLTSSHVVSPASSSPSSSSNPRPGRLRGFSYLRHYTHGHHHSQQSPAAPTVVTAATVSTAPQSRRAPSPPPPPRQRRATSPLNNTASNSWIPTVSGVSGLSRVASTPAELSTSLVHATNVSPGSGQQGTEINQSARSIGQAISTDRPLGHQPNATMVRSPANPTTRMGHPSDQPAPSIRFTSHSNSQSGRESLHFAPIERTLHTKDERIRVGRFSDRDVSNPNAPVGFKSKVVSRRHCEFWCDNGQWYVKDVKSSSGTFLNHIRLSAPGMESRAYPLNDGDMLQLGIDFKGGEEQIFRCVKIRVELNRAWQKALNNFNMSAHRRLRNLAKSGKESDACSTNSSECAICLLPVAPCQALFVAPCSHVWHYKCIRPLIEKEYPSFLCPNCRAMADLDRDIEEDEFTDELWEVIPDNMIGMNDDRDTQSLETNAVATAGTVGVGEATTATTVVTAADAEIAGPSRHRPPPSSVSATTAAPEIVQDPIPPDNPEVGSDESTPTSAPVPTTPPRQSGSWRRRDLELANVSLSRGHERSSQLSEESSSSSSGNEHGQEGPMTPMNDAGPFVLDGGDGHDRDGRRETLFMPLSLDP